MASNHNNPYSYPYQQSAAQQYPAYQTAPAPNNVAQPSHQYQQPSTGQANDYMSYQPPSYGGQASGYAADQDDSWGGSAYSATRETTSRAAEVLRNMSNPSYAPNGTTASQLSVTAANAGTSPSARYSTNSSRAQPQQTHATHSSYSQSQDRPRSVNANRTQQPPNRGLPSSAQAAGYPLQRAQTMYNQQQQRPASPVQHQYSNTSATPASFVRNSTMTAVASQPYTDYDRRQLASVDASRANQSATPSTSYNYVNVQTVAPLGPIEPPVSSIPETYTGQSSITVDPTAVYDPWPEYQRKEDARRAQKAIEDAARAGEGRIAEEAREAEEIQMEDERKRQEVKRALSAADQPKQIANKRQQQNAAEAGSAAQEASAGPGDALEAEIRAMMAKMRELNGKDPALLARIWEEERRAKASPKSPTGQNKSAPQATAAPAAQASTHQVANQRRKAVPREPPKPATPVPVPAAVTKPQAQVVSTRAGGHTIWPPEKKAQLAAAAAIYLNNQNPNNHVDPARIFSMLDSNPSYIELCEQLETIGLRLDRAAFAKNLLTAVPDVNSSTRKATPQPAPFPVQRAQVPPAIMKNEVATLTAANPAFAAASPASRSSFPPFPKNASPAANSVPVAEMVPIKPELKPPANKEEAARKRNLSDLVDLTQLSEDDDMDPPPKKLNADSMYTYDSPHPHFEGALIVDSEPLISNFPVANIPARPIREPTPQSVPIISSEIRYKAIVEPLDKKKALRRNTYNPATIARDVLLASGRHPTERQLNSHLDVLRLHLSPVGFDSDLSTIKWDVLDPGNPPPGYFKDSIQGLTKNTDDEDSSADEDRETRPWSQSNAIGGEGGVQTRVQALPEAINPFKQQKRRSRPPRQSLPSDLSSATPKRATSTTKMSASAPRPTASGVGYSAFREYGPDGQPLPKKRGRPVGWRKAIHGSVAAVAQPPANGHTAPSKYQPSQPSSLRNVRTGGDKPIRIDSRSPSVVNRVLQYQSYPCKWQNCSAELHNLETLKKHVFKVHRKETLRNTLECLWGDCGREISSHDPTTNFTIEQHTPYSFDLESNWRSHIQQNHFDPLSWELGDGPASGLSDAHDSEAYLSDAQGRRVTPRITVDPERAEKDVLWPQAFASAARGRGRPPKNTQEKEAREAQERLVSQKRRIGGPGMDRGGATLVNEKRRKGFNDSDELEEELVAVED